MKIDFGNTCILIVRVSTNVQDYTAQVEQLTRVAQSKGLTIVDVVQPKESGFRSIDKKEGFNELTEKLAQHKCRYVLATELSRLARRKYILETIKQFFIDNTIQLWIEDMRFQLFADEGTVDMTSDIVFSVFASIAENEMLEKKARKERVIGELNLEGYAIMGKTPFGYTKVETEERIRGKKRRKVVVDEEQAQQVRAVYDMCINGINGDPTKSSMSLINKECIARGYHHYLHSERNVCQCLKYHPYTGEVEHSKHMRKNTAYWSYGEKNAPKYVESGSKYRLPQIIPVETFQAVQDKLKQTCTRNDRDSIAQILTDKSRKHNTLLTKLIICPQCGSFYMGEYRLRKNGVLSCYYRCKSNTPHTKFQLSMRNTDYAIWGFCKAHYSQFIKYIELLPSTINEAEIEQRIINYRAKEKELENEITELGLRFLRVGKNDKTGQIAEAYDMDVASLKADIESLEAKAKMEETRLAEIKQSGALAANRIQTIEYVESSKDEMAKYIRQIVEKVIAAYHDDRYVVLQVVLKDGAMRYSTIDLDDHNVDDYEHRDYIVIDQKDTWFPRFLIASGPVLFDPQNAKFSVMDKDPFAISLAFEDEDGRYFKDIPYQRLDLYSKEAPKNQVSNMPLELPDRRKIGIDGINKRWGK